MSTIIGSPASNMLSRSDGPVGVTVSRKGFAAKIIARRLTMIPFRPVARTIRTDDAVPGCDLVPQLRLGRAGRADATHVAGKPVGVERVELVGETADSEGGRPIRREHGREGQPRAACFAYGVFQPNREFGMQTADRQVRALQCHGVTGAR